MFLKAVYYSIHHIFHKKVIFYFSKGVKAYIGAIFIHFVKLLPITFEGQSWGSTSHSTARVIYILGQVCNIATCGGRTYTEMIACD